ncbi:MAG TPA: glycoside hydrolase family 3 N-terminal domain-containing protein [Candidatus Saccharimonadales bacterium]|nr:glycoside hydrolase family 3 N-terminal domain-containing protein [Candidatus Saccharimonadales bacterium]
MKRRALIAAAAQAAAVTACAPLADPGRGPSAAASAVADDRVGRIIAGLSLDERAGQLMNVSWHGTTITPALEAMIRVRKVGGVLIHAENFDDAASLRALTAALQRIARDAKTLPLFIAIDQEGGAVTRIGRGATLLPGTMALAATPDPTSAVRTSVGILCRDMRATGVNWDLAPDADVNNEPRNPIILNRSFGSDPSRVAELVAAAVRAFAEERFLCCAKHFPGHGATTVDSHSGLPDLEIDRARLDAVELVPFRAAISANVPAIMSAHIRVPALDPTLDLPVTLSPAVMTGLLRVELGFRGLLVTDDLEMGALTKTRSQSEAGYQAFAAGADLLLFRFDESAQQDAHRRLVAGMTGGSLTRMRVDASLRRIVELKDRYGLLDAAEAAGQTGTAADRTTADGLARQSITVLRPGGLPLRGRILVASVSAPDIATLADQPTLGAVLRERLPAVTARTIGPAPTAAEIASLVSAARDADVVVVGTADASANPQQAALVTALAAARTTVLVSLRSPYDILAAPRAQGYVCAYTGREPTLRALADVLSGAVAPVGTLPVDLPGAYRIGDGLKKL